MNYKIGGGKRGYTVRAPGPTYFSIAAPSPAARSEGNSGSTIMPFVVRRTGDLSYLASVNWTVSGAGGSPASSGDFASPLTGTLSFAPGQAVATIDVAVSGDTSVEPDEGFQVALSSPSTLASIIVGSAAVTILDDDTPVGTPDTTPDAFSFTDLTNVTLSTVETSNAITISGLGLGVTVAATVSGDSSSEIQVNLGSWTSGPATVGNGDVVKVRHTSSATNSTGVSTTLTIGGVSDTFTTTTSVLATIVYDASIGNGVDSSGFTTLPLRSGGTRYFAGNGGSDSNDGLTHATRLATVNAAIAKITVYASAGDQIMLAEGSTFNEGIPNLAGKGGFSPLYPTAFQSYDPTDPNNEAKHGRAYQRSAWPVITGTGQMASNIGPPTYLAFRGIDWNPGNVSGAGLLLASEASYLLWEGCRLHYTALSIDSGVDPSVSNLPTAAHVILRNSAVYGAWATTGFSGGLYCAGFDHVTVEDCLFYHCGWKIGTSRTRPAGISDSEWWAMGGPNVFSHPLYLQTNTSNNIVRRNIFADSADTATMRGDGTWTENVHIHEPTGSGLGNSSHNENRPLGLDLIGSYNLHIGAINMDSADDRGIAFTTSNGKPGSRVHHNLMIYSQVYTGQNAEAFGQYAALAQHAYMEFDHNISFVWTLSGKTYFTQTGADPVVGAYAPYNHVAYDYNQWDDPASGTNTNSGAATYPNPYTEASLLTAAGVTNYATLINLAIAHPEQHYQRTIRSLAFAGYGITVPDSTAPVLSLPVGSSTGASTATVGATTNEGNGRISCVLTTSSTPPHPAQVKMGLTSDHVAAAAAGLVSVSSTGAKTINLSSLAAGTYYAHLVHEDVDGNKSNVVSSASFTVGSAAAIWNGASDSPASSTAWSRSGTNHVATQTANDDTLAQLFASQARSTGTVKVTVTARGTGSTSIFGGGASSIPFTIGLDDGSESTYIGVHNGLGYRCDGVITFGGGDYSTGHAALTDGDELKIVKTSSDVEFYVNNALQFTFSGSDYTASAIAGAAYPAATSIGSHDTSLMIDGSSW